MYFEVTGEETKKNKIVDLSFGIDETKTSFITMVPKLSVDEKLEDKIEELCREIRAAQGREHMDEDESGYRKIPARIQFYIERKDDKIILSGNLSHAFFILINAKTISKSFYEFIRSNSEAKKLIDETSGYILPIYRMEEDDEMDKQEGPSQQTIVDEIENLGRKIKELNGEARERAISALLSSVIENTSPEERNELSKRFAGDAASPAEMSIK